jgi:hypothetical protein
MGVKYTLLRNGTVIDTLREEIETQHVNDK